MSTGTTGLMPFPRVDPQLQNGEPTSSADCSVMTIQGGIRWATRGQLWPSVPAIRAKIGVPAGGLSMSQALAAYQGYGVAAVIVHTMADVQAALQAGRFVHAAVQYGWVNTNAPELSGDRNFTGNHGLGLFGYENVGLNPDWCAWLDPLHDGRRGLPKQIRMAKFTQVTGAMSAMKSGVTGIVVTKGPRT